MKNLFKCLVIVFLGTIHHQTKAQTFEIKGGFNFANMKLSEIEEQVDFKGHTGFHLGGLVDFSFGEILSLETGLFYTIKGVNTEMVDSGVKMVNKVNLNYIELPVYLKAKKELKSNTFLYGSVGPYFAIGLGGKVKTEMSYLSESQSASEKIEWGDEGDLKRFDMGLTFGLGVEYNSILLGLYYDLGLSNISSYQEDGVSIKNRVFRVSVGYVIGG